MSLFANAFVAAGAVGPRTVSAQCSSPPGSFCTAHKGRTRENLAVGRGAVTSGLVCVSVRLDDC